MICPLRLAKHFQHSKKTYLSSDNPPLPVSQARIARKLPHSTFQSIFQRSRTHRCLPPHQPPAQRQLAFD